MSKANHVPPGDNPLRTCVFCGKPPFKNTPEHILPDWLIRLTGNPKRTVTFGTNWRTTPPSLIRHSFSKFKFPACKKCNGEFSHLENVAKSTLQRMLNDDPVSSADVDSFFDWLDKVRVGLWLALRVRDRNYMGIEPSFAILGRVGKADRLMSIYKSDNRENRLSYFGTESPVFRMMPSCFFLTINHLHFFNVSHQFMLHDQFGFPIVTQRKVRPGSNQQHLNLQPGRMHLGKPLAPFDIRVGGFELYQVIVPLSMRNQNQKEFNELYESEYVKSMMSGLNSGKSILLSHRPSRPSEYLKVSTVEMASIQPIEARALRNSLMFQVLDWQENMQMAKTSVFLDRFSAEQIDTFAWREHKILAHHQAMRIAITEWIDSSGL